jgi:hypothetical protein
MKMGVRWRELVDLTLLLLYYNKALYTVLTNERSELVLN